MKNNSLNIDSKRHTKRLSKKAWNGTDASLEISLFEYNLIWKENKDGFQFIHKCSHGKGFTTGVFKKDLDFKKEFNWIDEKDWQSFLSCNGYDSFEQWNSIFFCFKIYDLVNYYGVENVFGSDYHEGFNVKFI